MNFKTVSFSPDLQSSPFKIVKMEVHANGLTHPGHLEFTKDGRLLVSEFGRGRIMDITSPGDYRDSQAFAYGLRHPAAIVTNYLGDRIVVADSGRDAVLISPMVEISPKPAQYILESQPLMGW